MAGMGIRQAENAAGEVGTVEDAHEMNAHPKNEHSVAIFYEGKTVYFHVSGNLIRMEIDRNEQPKLTYQFAADVCPLPKKNP